MKYDLVYEYVKKYFKDNFLEAYLIFDGRIEYIEKKYIELYNKKIKNKYNIDDIKNNKNLDDINMEVNNILNQFVLEYFTESQIEDCELLYNNVKNILIDRGINKNFSNEIFEHIVKLVMARLWSQFDRSRLNKEDFNHVINIVYNNTCNQYARMIGKKIENILDSRLDFFEMQKLGVDKTELKRNVINSIFKNENVDFLVKIRNLVIIEGNSLSRIGILLNKYINQYFSNYSDKYDSTDKKIEVKPRIRNNSNSDKKVNISNKSNLNNNDVMLNREVMKNNSVRKEGFPSRIKLNAKQVKIAKAVALLAVLGALVGVGVGISNTHEYTDSEYAVMRVEALDIFDYTNNWKSNKVDDIADNIISVYSKLGQLPDENYKTLGLYNAYDSIIRLENLDDALVKMQSLLNLLRNKMVKEEINENLRTTIKADIDGEYYFIDFVYDTLVNAGYNEYKNEEYQNLLLRYKYANFGNYFGVVGVSLKEREKEMIRDMMNKYQEYYKNSEEKIGELVVSGDYSFFATYTGKGR